MDQYVGKGMFREIRRLYPQANIVGIDYDPGASEVNQLNRLKLMISTAFMSQQAESAQDAESAVGRSPEPIADSRVFGKDKSEDRGIQCSKKKRR